MASSAAEARRTARSALARWGLSALEDSVSLLVTELTSNAIRHARSELELVVSFDGTCVRIAVSDCDPTPPTARSREELTIGGWGLALVDALADAWGTEIDGDSGKTVWLEIDARPVTA